MKLLRYALSALCMLPLASAYAQETVKVGVIAQLSGPVANFGNSWVEAISAYQKIHGTTVAGKKVEIIYKDLPELNPAGAVALAKELIIKDKVQYLAGMSFSAEVSAVADVAKPAKVPVVMFQSLWSPLIDRSEYLLRSSYTLPQVAYPVGQYAAQKQFKRVITMVSDFASGHDAARGFVAGFSGRPGEIVQEIRIPLKTSDYGPFMQRARSMKPDAIFMFVPGGPPALNLIKAYQEYGLKADGVTLLGTSETWEVELGQMGEAALGVETGLVYSPVHESAKNKQFVEALRQLHPRSAIGYSHVIAYDGMHMIYKMIEATRGERDGDKAIAAIKGMTWESPRGVVRVDPVSRDLIQNVYMRRVVRDNGAVVNKEFKTFEMQPDHARSIK